MARTASLPRWQDLFEKNLVKIHELYTNSEVMALVQKANLEYLHWDRLRYQKMPAGIEPELAWAFVKLTRQGNRENLPIRDQKRSMTLSSSREHLQSLSYIDRYSAGSIISIDGLPDETQKDRMVIDGLIEEAISSSQIEGANTTRKVAKAMIEMKRAPKNKDERMILNNYRAMTRIEDWKKRELNDDFLLELHHILSEGTMDRPEDAGRFRSDEDEVVVVDRLTGDIVHTPPSSSEALKMLRQLYAFANDEGKDSYIHPFIKASILHFSMGYIHPFVDGNGRIARALFYWYLIKKDYWMFKFLPISLQIKKKEWRPGYDRAFQHVESDELDLTYFINYKLRLACNAIEDFISYIAKKQKEANRLKQRFMARDEINSRQLELIGDLQGNAAMHIDLRLYQERNRISYETARSDLAALEKKKILASHKSGRKFIYMRGERFPSR